MFSMVVSFYTSRLVLATLGVEDYGVFNVVGGMVVMFSFLNASMSGATSRFLTFALGKGDKEELQKTFSAALTIHILIAFFLLILAETAGLWYLENKMVIPPDRMNVARVIYQFTIVSSIVTIIQTPYNATIIAHERMNIFAYIEILNTCLKLGIVYLLIIAPYDKLILYAMLLFVVSCLIASSYRLYCIRQFQECRYRFEWNKNLIYPMLSFSGWNVLGCGAFVGTTQGINMILNLFFGIVVNAAYGVSTLVKTAIYSFVQSFQTAVNPQIIKLYAVGKINELYSLIFQNATFSFSLMWLLLLPISLHMETILHIWLVEVPEYTPLFCRLILIQSLVACVKFPFAMTIHATGKMKVFQLSSGTVLLSALPVSYFFLKAGASPHIPFYICIIASVIELIIILFLLKRWINLSFISLFKTVMIPLSLIVVISVPVSVLASYYFPFLLAFLFSGLSVCLSVYYIVFNKETRKNVIVQVKNIFTRT